MRTRLALWVAAGAAGIAAALLAASGAGAAGCIVLCPTTTAPPAPVSGPPTASGLVLTAVSATSVAVTVTVNPDGNPIEVRATTYGAELNNPDGTTGADTDIPAGDSPVTVHLTMTGLTPGTKDTINVDVSNSVGGGVIVSGSVTMPLKRKAPVTLIAAGNTFPIHGNPDFSVRVHGSLATYEEVRLEAQPLVGGAYHTVATANVAPGSTSVGFTSGEARNSRYRAVLTGKINGHQVQVASTSNPLVVYTAATPDLTITSAPGAVIAAQTFQVHPVKGSFAGEPIYFYKSLTRTGLYTRVTSVRLRSEHRYVGLIGATARIPATGRIYIATCWRGRILPDMGPPLRDTGCGGPTYRVG